MIQFEIHSRFIIITYISIMILVFPLAHAQSNDLSSVLNKAKKSLSAKGNETQNTTIKASTSTSVPQTSDIYLQTKLNYNPSNKFWYFPSQAVLNFTKSNKLCPQLPCRQQLERLSLDTNAIGQDEFFIAGGLKIEDKKASTPDLIAWKLYQIVGWSLKVTGVKENLKLNQTTYAFNGSFKYGIRNSSLEPRYCV
jgi:hypothetical protein